MNFGLMAVLHPPGRPSSPQLPGQPDPCGSRFSRSPQEHANRRQPRPRPPRPRRQWLLLGIVLIIAALVRLQWLDFHLDDAYITYVYARSLAAGHGFSFNGLRVLGTTSPIYALTLAIPAALGISIPAASKALGLAGALAGCGLLFHLARRPLGVPGALFAALLLALNGVHASMSMSGMETGTYLAVCLAALAAQRAHRERSTGLLSALACLLRPDGVLLAAVLALVHRQEGRKVRFAPLAWFFGPLALWAGYATLLFGSPVPSSLSAKLAYHDYGAFTLGAALNAEGARLWPVLSIAALVGLIGLYGRFRALLPLCAWTALYLLMFLRAPNFNWYYAPPLAGLIVLGVAGLVEISERVMRLPLLQPRGLGGWAVLAGATALIVTTGFDLYDQGRFVDRTHGLEVTGTYRQLGEWLAANTPPETRVGTPEVGYIAYYSRRPILDLAGLCSPEVIPYLQRRDYVGIVRDLEPGFVALTLEGRRPIHNTITASPWFRDHYVERVRFPYRGSAYVIWQRRLDDAP